MAIRFGKLERLIEVPSAGWGGTLTESAGGGGTAVQMTAGELSYISSPQQGGGSDFLEYFAEDLEESSANTQTYTVSISAGEGGTGLVTISSTGAFTLSWGSTDLRDLLGFTGNLSPAATSFVGTQQAQGLWLADVPMVTPYGPSDDGTDEADTTTTESPAGYVKSLYYQRKRVMSVTWPACSRAKTRIAGESTTNESFERFWRDCLLAEKTWAVGAGGNVRLYWDADDDATYFTGKVVGDALRSFRPQQVQDGWIELWRIELPRIVKDPTT